MTVTIDISTLNYDEWLSFVFDHPIHEPLWHFSGEWGYDVSNPEKTLGYITQLFKNPAILLKRFSLPHIEQGFWFLPSPNGLMWLLVLPTIPWEARREAIRSIGTLFNTLFSQVELNNSVYMWWDSLIEYCAWENQDVITDRQVLEEIVAVLSKLNASSSSSVQKSTRHGVGRLQAIANKEADKELDGMLKSFGLISPS